MPTLQQKKEIEDIIATAFKLETTLTKLKKDWVYEPDKASKAVKKKRYDDRLAEIAAHLNNAIKLADKHYGIALPDEARGEPTFDKDTDFDAYTMGYVDPRKPDIAKGDVSIGRKGFVWKGKPSADWLASTKYHELYGHCKIGFHSIKLTEGQKQVLKNKFTKAELDSQRSTWPKIETPESEVISHFRELEWASKNGLPKDMLAETKARLRRYFNALSPDKQKEWKEKIPWLAKLQQPLRPQEWLAALELAPGTQFLAADLRQLRYREAISLSTAAHYGEYENLEEFLAMNPRLRLKIAGASAAPALLCADDFQVSEMDFTAWEELEMQGDKDMKFLATDEEIINQHKLSAKNREAAAAKREKMAKEKAAAAQQNRNDTSKNKNDAGEKENEGAEIENKASKGYSKAAKSWDKIERLETNESEKKQAREKADDLRTKARNSKERAATAHERAVGDFESTGNDTKQVDALDAAASERDELAKDKF
jgi:hypothetical protein